MGTPLKDQQTRITIRRIRALRAIDRLAGAARVGADLIIIDLRQAEALLKLAKDGQTYRRLTAESESIGGGR